MEPVAEPYRGFKAEFDAACAEFGRMRLQDLRELPQERRGPQAGARHVAYTAVLAVKSGARSGLPQWTTED